MLPDYVQKTSTSSDAIHLKTAKGAGRPEEEFHLAKLKTTAESWNS